MPKPCRLSAWCFCGALFAQAPPPPPASYQPTEDERARISSGIAQLEKRVASLRGDAALITDVDVFLKAARWIVRFPDEFFTKEYAAHTLAAIEKGMQRAAEVEAGKPSWPSRRGRVIRAYRSRVDGSVQPYAVFVPESYDPAKPIRLDVVLHGRGATLNEVSFIAQHEGPRPPSPDTPHMQLHVFGRTNNAYRWAGETDVFEALENVRARYNIDADRIVLRGFSMGGAGAWHLGLHYPDMWAAVESGAGFTETRRYARLADVPPHVENTLRIYDAADWALNAWNVPMVGYGGEDDPQLQASLNIRERIAAEGLNLADMRMLFLVGPKTGHRWHPESLAESNRFLDEAASRGRRAPDHIRFVTYTTRYNRCHWITVEALENHFERAEVEARREGGRVVVTTKNVARLKVDHVGEVVIDGKRHVAGLAGELAGKKHGLQGPIDDAFLNEFLCVRPSGPPDPELEKFSRAWAKYMRGDVPVKDEALVTNADMRRTLVLFGEPANNRVLARLAPHMPIVWAKNVIQMGPRSTAKRYPAAHYRLAMVHRNPLSQKYVVLGTGHTFGEADFRGTNALLYPRLGDWAIIEKASGKVVETGFFDENWNELRRP
jgi:dienelactone hydrolase